MPAPGGRRSSHWTSQYTTEKATRVGPWRAFWHRHVFRPSYAWRSTYTSGSHYFALGRAAPRSPHSCIHCVCARVRRIIPGIALPSYRAPPTLRRRRGSQMKPNKMDSRRSKRLPAPRGDLNARARRERAHRPDVPSAGRNARRLSSARRGGGEGQDRVEGAGRWA